MFTRKERLLHTPISLAFWNNVFSLASTAGRLHKAHILKPYYLLGVVCHLFVHNVSKPVDLG